MIHLLAIVLIAYFAAPASAQDLLGRIATLEQNNTTLLSRMASVESKIDALTAKVDKLASVGSGVYPLTPGPLLTESSVSACSGNTMSYAITSGAGGCGSSAAADACGSSGASSGGSFMQRGPIRRFLFGGRLRGGSAGCGG